MNSRNRVRIVFVITGAVILAQANLASSQKVSIGGKNRGENRNDDDGSRRNRSRDNKNEGREQFGGSDAQKIQRAIQDIQGNPQFQQPPGEPASAGGHLHGGKQFHKSQHSQDWQQHHSKGDWKKKRKHDYWRNWALHVGGPTPFSVQWYNDHPHAWHHRHHHDHDAWQIATAAGVLGWLGWHGNHPHHTTVIYEPFPVEAIYVEGQPAFDPNAGQWMTLGVYSLLTGSGDSGTRMLELAIDKHGHIRGNYFDMITNVTYTLTGRIHEPTHYVQWTLDKNKQFTFYTPLSQLTQPEGIVHVRFPSGQKEQWEIVRMENAGN